MARKKITWENLSPEMLTLFRELLKDADEVEFHSEGKRVGRLTFEKSFLEPERQRASGLGHKARVLSKAAQARRGSHKTGAIPPGAVGRKG
jgi:hypothetical protein